MRKGQHKEKTNLDKISEASHLVTQTNNQHCNRVSLGAMMLRPLGKTSSKTINQADQTIQQKEAKIKWLQEAIMDKKEKNDAIQEAFSLRHEQTDFFNITQKPIQKLQIIGAACSKIVGSCLFLKQSLLKTLVTTSRIAKISRQKGAKIILIWLIGILSRLFGILSKVLNH